MQRQLLHKAWMLVWVLGASLALYAQPGQCDPAQMEARLRQDAATLGLDEDQTNSFVQINLDFARQARELRDQATDRTQLRPQMEALRVERDETLGMILSEAQLAQWRAIEEERRKNRPGPGGPGGSGQNPRRPGGNG